MKTDINIQFDFADDSTRKEERNTKDGCLDS